MVWTASLKNRVKKIYDVDASMRQLLRAKKMG